MAEFGEGEVIEFDDDRAPVVVRGGKFVPADEESPAADFFGGLGAGGVRGGQNLLQRIGLLTQSDERDQAFRQEVAQNPVATTLGQGGAAMLAAAPGMIMGSSVATGLALGRVATFALSSLGGGIGAAMTEEAGVRPGESLLGSMGIDAIIAGGTGGIGALGRMGARVVDKTLRTAQRLRSGQPGLAGSKFETRDVVAGDLPGEDAVRRLQDEFDVPLTPAQASGSATDRALEGSLQSSPFRGGFDDISREQREVATRVASKSIGLDTITLDRGEMSKATKQIGARIQKVTDDIGPMTVDPATIAEMRALADTRFIKSGTRSEIQRIADELEGIVADGGTLSPEQFRGMRQAVSTELGSSDGQTATALGGILRAVDEIPITALGAQGRGREAVNLQRQYGEAREQWQNLIALKRSSSVDADGAVRIRSLTNNLDSIYGDRALDPSQLSTETANLFAVGDAFGSGRMAPRRTSGTAENLQVDRALGVAGDAASAILSGNPAGLASGGVFALGNAVLNPMFLSRPLPTVADRVIGAFGTGAASTLVPDDL